MKESAIEKNTIVTWISSTTHLPQETKNSVFCVVAQDLLLLLTIWTWKSVTLWVMGITELSIWELPFWRCGGKAPKMDGWMDHGTHPNRNYFYCPVDEIRKLLGLSEEEEESFSCLDILLELQSIGVNICPLRAAHAIYFSGWWTW